jgi:hypothetical protein
MKIVLLIIIIICPVLSFYKFPAQFDLLNTYLDNYISIISFSILIPMIFLGGYGIGEVWLLWPIYIFLVYSFPIIFGYLVSCLIVFSWDNIFGRLGKEKRKYVKISITFLIVIFILVAVILPTIGTFFVTIETNTRQNISFDEAFSEVKLQELRIQNHFIFPVTYKLPDVAACVYDIEENLIWGYTVTYRTEDGEYVRDMDPYHRNVIVAKPGTETKIYLQEWIGILGVNHKEVKNNIDKFDEIILLSNVGFNNYDCCSEVTEEDILASEKIKILK